MRLAPQEIRTYFLTTVTAERRRVFQVSAKCELLQETLFAYRENGKYQLHAYAIMPDHVHLCLTPAPDVSLEKAMQFIKGGFSFRLKSRIDIWQRGFNEVQIKTPEKFAACRQYVEQNPVRKCMVEKAEDYPFSSASDVRVDAAPPHLRG